MAKRNDTPATTLQATVVNLAEVTLKPPRRSWRAQIRAIAESVSKLPAGKALLFAPGTYKPHWVSSFRQRGLIAGIDNQKNLIVGRQDK